MKKCPKCKHQFEYEKPKVDLKTKTFMEFFMKESNCKFVSLIECPKCKINFGEEDEEN